MLNRLALRLAAIEALAPHGTAPTGPWPTLAAQDVLDSQVAPVSLIARTPVIGVFTDDSDVSPYGSGPDTGDGQTVATLALEVAVPLSVVDANKQSTVVLAAETDAMAEAMLDLIEAQVMAALENGRTEGALAHVLIEFQSAESRPWRDPDTSARLSARRVEIKCRIMREGPLSPAVATGLDQLPSPLREVAMALPENSDGRKICDVIANSAPSAPVFTALEQIRIAAALKRSDGSAPPPINGDGKPADIDASINL